MKNIKDVEAPQLIGVDEPLRSGNPRKKIVDSFNGVESGIQTIHYECQCPICGQKVGIGFLKGTRYSVIRYGSILCGLCGMHFIPNTDEEGGWVKWAFPISKEIKG